MSASRFWVWLPGAPERAVLIAAPLAETARAIVSAASAPGAGDFLAHPESYGHPGRHLPLHELLEPFRAELRLEGFLVNPWRLGRKVGAAGLVVPCPYGNPDSAKRWRLGVELGAADRRQAEREARKAAKASAP